MKSTKQHLIQILAQFKYKFDRVNYPINKTNALYLFLYDLELIRDGLLRSCHQDQVSVCFACQPIRALAGPCLLLSESQSRLDSSNPGPGAPHKAQKHTR